MKTIGKWLGFAVALGWGAWGAAQTAVLYTGSDWCSAESPFVEAWRAPDFAAQVGVTMVEVDEPEVVTDAVRAKWQEQQAWRLELANLPAFAYFDAAGRCVYLREGLWARDGQSARGELLSALSAGRQSEVMLLEALASRDGEGVGAALQALVVPFGVERSRGGNVLKALWEHLRAVDPKDETGWAFALTFDPAGDPAERVRTLRERGDEAGFEAYYRELAAHPARHLSVNQRQGLRLLRYAFYGKVPGRAEEMRQLLREVAAMGGETHFGIAAQGLLCLAGEGPVAVPYGWFPDHAKAGELRWPIELGMKSVMTAAGWYELTLRRTAGQGAMRVARLLIGGVRKPLTAGELPVGSMCALRFPLSAEEVGQAVTLLVSFDHPEGERGELALREILPPRPELAEPASGEPWAARAGEPAVCAYARQCIPEEAFRALMRRPGGADFLSTLFGDQAWLEALFANGEPRTSWSATLGALETLAHLYDLADARLRRWAVAAALNAGEDPTPMVLFFRNLLALRDRGHLWKGAEALSVAQLRYVFLPDQAPAESLLYLAARHNVPPRRYDGVCWFPPYRLFNFFGESIHGADYYPPWRHAYLRHQEARLVGGVCGALSYYGSAAAKAAGVPSTPAGQPGHCAYTLWKPSEARWCLAYNVNPYSETHFDPWDRKGPFSQEELAAVAFAHPGRLEALRAFWQIEVRKPKDYAPEADNAYREALALCPPALTIARAWGDWLAACPDTPAAALSAYIGTVAESLRGYPECLLRTLERAVLPALVKVAPSEEVVKTLCALQPALRQPETKSDEPCNFAALFERQLKLLGEDDAPRFQFLAAALDAQFGTPDAFGQLLRWAAGKTLQDPARAKRFIALLTELLERRGHPAQNPGKFLAGAIREASQADNLEAFNALCDLQDALAADKRAPYDFPGLPENTEPLLSGRALLRISTTSGWDHPEAYRHLLDGLDPTEICHTAEESTPWAEVRLPGMVELSAVYLLNRSHLYERLVPFTLEASPDGTTWYPLGSSTEAQERYLFTFAPIKARHVRVTCHPGEGAKTFLHLRKFALFGRKLY